MRQAGIKTLVGNTGALAALQIVNYVAPILLIPYLTRVLGIELYGVVALGLAMVQIACMLTDYGFNLSATYQIARCDGDRAAIDRIVGAVMACKAGLMLLAGLLLALFIGIDHKYDGYEIYFWLLLMAVFGQTFQPVWFFQGVEKMFYITLYTSVSRLLYIVAVLLLVTSAKDYYWVAVFNGASHIVAAVIGIVAMLNMGYRPALPSLQSVRSTFSESTPFFWSRAAAAAYTAGGTVFLGIASTPVQAALYSAAEQLYKGAAAMVMPLNQALYPYMTRTKNVPLFWKIFKAALLVIFLGLVTGIVIGPWIITTFFGASFAEAYPILVVFMCVLAFMIPSSLLGYPFLAALGNLSVANKSVIYGGLLQVILLVVCYLMGWTLARQTVFTVLLVEMAVFTQRAMAARKLSLEMKAVSSIKIV